MCHFTRTIRSINHRWTAIISITICGFLINDEAHLLAHDTAPIQVLVTAAVVGALLLMAPYPRFGAWGNNPGKCNRIFAHAHPRTVRRSVLTADVPGRRSPLL